MGIEGIVRDFRRWAGPNYVIEKKDPKERTKYEQLRKMDCEEGRVDGEITLAEFLRYLGRQNPALHIDMLSDVYAARQVGTLTSDYPGIEIFKLMAADNLTFLKPKWALPAIIETLANPKIATDVRLELTNTIKAIGEKSVSNDLRNIMNNHGDPVGSACAAIALGKLWFKEAFSPLVEALKNSTDAAVRVAIVDVLGDMHDGRAVPVLITSLGNDKNEDVRGQAATVLISLNDPKAVPALGRAMRYDESNEVRITAKIALSVMKISRDEDDPVRELIEIELNSAKGEVQ